MKFVFRYIGEEKLKEIMIYIGEVEVCYGRVMDFIIVS